jgi:DNA invertase Pin-like site-specific DNA recombinase
MEENRRSLRCAIYTRKSTEEGLEQQFNTLQAQREAAEAYIRSQQLSGWIALSDAFDDGGFTEANMDRPALKQLLAAIEERRVDCVVVYKVDRLSRSLLDFARLMALFDRYGVSFVSVTQEFNTTTSLGRLTLNILLSFAQFEREIISERTRDKLSAARRKGKWIGGIPVLGYDVDLRGGRLAVNQKEAELVREIFAICDKAGTLSASLQEVNAQGLRTKCWTSRGGREHAGKTLCKSSLGALLRNVLYKGCISHKGTIYPGEQRAIVDTKLWERVNRKLELRRASQVGREHQKQEAFLHNLIRCGECGTTLVATYTKRRGKRHNYYVCPKAKRHHGCKQPPVATEDLDASVRRRVETVVGGNAPTLVMQQSIGQIVYAGKTRQVIITLQDRSRIEYSLPVPNRRGVRSGSKAATGRVPRISKLMALAIRMEKLVGERQASDYAALASHGSVSRPRLSQIMSLTNLAPDIQETLLFLPKTMAGPDPITERRLRSIAQIIDWSMQKELFRELMSRSDFERQFLTAERAQRVRDLLAGLAFFHVYPRSV